MDKKFKLIKDTNPEDECYYFAFSVNSREEVLDIFSNFLDLYFEIRTNPKKGDLVLFFSDFPIQIKHACIIWKTNKNFLNTIVRAQFLGQNGLFEFKINDTPDVYGRNCSIWRRK